MTSIKLIIGWQERWVSRMHYEYFRPYEMSEEYYLAFLKKYFPYDFEDSYSKMLYTDSVPEYIVTDYDRELARKANSDVFSFNLKEARDQYYKNLTGLRYSAGLDRGIIPNLYDNYDMSPRPCESPIYRRPFDNATGGIFTFEIESSDDDNYFYEWMHAGTFKEGKFIFYDGQDGDQTFKIEFWDCFCAGIEETMSSTGNTPMKMRIKISPAITRNRGVVHEKYWKETNINTVYTPYNRAEEKEEITPECTVYFRRSKDYDGTYGFDWMRMGDTEESKDVWYGGKDTDGKNVMSPDKYDKLIFSEYKHFDQEWRKNYSQYEKTYCYLIPWVTLMKGRKASFRVKMQVNQPSGTLNIRMNGSGSEVLIPSITEISADRTGDYYLNGELEVSCIGTFSSDTSLEVWAGEELVGKMIFVANEVTYKIKVAAITTKLLHENEKDNQISTLPTNLNTKLSYLNQAFIEYELIEGIQLDLTEKTLGLTFKGKEVNDFTGLFRWKDDNKIILGDNDPVKQYKNSIKEDIFQYVTRKMDEQLRNNPRKKEVEGAYRMYFFNEKAEHDKKGRAEAMPSKSCMIFKEYDYEDCTTTVHELLHCLGLEHPFQPKKTDIIYKRAATDNIMDNADDSSKDGRISLWYWQIKRIWQLLRRK